MAAVAAVLMVAGSSAAADSAPPPASTAKWQQALQQLPVPGIGCFSASYPAFQWRRTQCQPAPHTLYAAARTQRRQTVGGGPPPGDDYLARVSGGSLSSVTGSFDSFCLGATETGSFGGNPPTPDTFSLQLNTNNFMSNACAALGAPNPACAGWVQFLYSAHFPGLLIEFTLRDYNLHPFNAGCPPGWLVGGIDCAMNTTPVLTSHLTVQDLPGVTLAGSTGQGCVTAKLTTPSGTARAICQPDPLGLDGTHPTTLVADQDVPTGIAVGPQ
jgi:hypothetical protein